MILLGVSPTRSILLNTDSNFTVNSMFLPQVHSRRRMGRKREHVLQFQVWRFWRFLVVFFKIKKVRIHHRVDVQRTLQIKLEWAPGPRPMLLCGETPHKNTVLSDTLGWFHGSRPVVSGAIPLQAKNYIQLVQYPVHGTTNNEHHRFCFIQLLNHSPPPEHAN